MTVALPEDFPLLCVSANGQISAKKAISKSGFGRFLINKKVKKL